MLKPHLPGLLACMLVAASTSTAAPPHPSLPGGPVPDGLGVNIHFTNPKAGEMEMLAGAFSWVRMDFGWGGIERKKGEYNFSAFDHLLAELEQRRVHALFIFDYGNNLYDGGLSPHTEEGRAAFARWAAASVRHFKGHGILWEMWNEPNIGFWKPAPNVDDYVKLALAVGKAVREAEPGECYVGPGTSNVDLKFMEACFKAGLLEYWSAVTCHPYRQGPPETAAENYRALRLLIERYKPQGRTIPILSGEWGYSVGWHQYTEERQGKYLPRQWLTNLWQQIPLSIWYDWHDDGVDPKEPEHHFGTVHNAYLAGKTPVYEPKPSYLAAITLVQQLRGFRFNKRLAMQSPDDFVLLFSKGDDAKDVKLAVWTTAKDPHEATIPASDGPFAAVSYLGDGQPAIAASGKTLKVRLTDTVLYLAPQQPNALLQTAAAWDRLPLESFKRAPFPSPAGTGAPVDRGTELIELPTPCPAAPQYAQVSAIVVTNPLRVELRPTAGGAMLRVGNPSGEALRAVARLRDVKGAQFKAAELPLELAAGQTEAIVQFEAIGARGSDTAAAVEIVENNAVIARSPMVAGRAMPGFAAESYKFFGDGDAKVQAEQSLAAGSPLESVPEPGMVALKLTVRKPQPGWKFWRVVPAAAELRKIDGRPKEYGLWLWGDGHTWEPRIRFVDSTGQTFQSAAERVEWKGWKFITFAMQGPRLTGSHWGGANDGVIHYPIHWDAAFLLDADSRKPTDGTVFIAGPVLVME